MALFSLLNSCYTGDISSDLDLEWNSSEDEGVEDEPIEGDLTIEDYQKFSVNWMLFVPDGGTFIAYDRMSDFLEALDPPFTFKKPNKYKLAAMDITICMGDLIYRKDIYDELVRDFYSRIGHPEEAVRYSEGFIEQLMAVRPGWRPVSSTLARQREIYCARLIQHAWRNYKSGPGIGKEEYRCRFKCVCALAKTGNEGEE